MKKTILVLMLCCAISALRAQSVLVVNNTPCTIYYQLFGDTGCGTKYESVVLSIPPLSNQFYGNPTLVPGGLTYMGTSLPPLGIFNAARMYNDDPNGSCTIVTNKVKDLTCYGAGANIAYHYTSDPSTCTDVCSVQITLTGSTANRQLTFR